MVHSGGILTNLSDGTSIASDIALLGQDILYSIASYAPTDASDNTISLGAVMYNTSTGQVIPLA